MYFRTNKSLRQKCTNGVSNEPLFKRRIVANERNIENILDLWHEIIFAKKHLQDINKYFDFIISFSDIFAIFAEIAYYFYPKCYIKFKIKCNPHNKVGIIRKLWDRLLKVQ